ncbi:hypothetical protein [Streptomyces sp. JJ36]|uniref:hypothetical protein n=1 Tax=Streptomyces sp. JJ36 TaxID=2736645 RepID=UPI001F238304|nr:hypothetical protein [Streptomyces sp. JJ36]MCF6524542.1 hypothetical protein [Streptomyces sp. JJ36]
MNLRKILSLGAACAALTLAATASPASAASYYIEINGKRIHAPGGCYNIADYVEPDASTVNLINKSGQALKYHDYADCKHPSSRTLRSDGEDTPVAPQASFYVPMYLG